MSIFKMDSADVIKQNLLSKIYGFIRGFFYQSAKLAFDNIKEDVKEKRRFNL